jgi:hypothetical protein
MPLHDKPQRSQGSTHLCIGYSAFSELNTEDVHYLLAAYQGRADAFKFQIYSFYFYDLELNTEISPSFLKMKPFEIALSRRSGFKFHPFWKLIISRNN